MCTHTHCISLTCTLYPALAFSPLNLSTVHCQHHSHTSVRMIHALTIPIRAKSIGGAHAYIIPSLRVCLLEKSEKGWKKWRVILTMCS